MVGRHGNDTVMVVVFAFLAFTSVTHFRRATGTVPAKEADAAIGDCEFRMIVDAGTGHDPTKSEVDHWLPGGEPNYCKHRLAAWKTHSNKSRRV